MMMSPLLAAIQFSLPGDQSQEIHKQKESASFRCFKVPTAGD
jgi:hypothetical protein